MDNRIGIISPFGNTVARSIILCLFAVASHHRDQLGAMRLLQTRPTLHFGYVATPDNPPSYTIHHALSFPSGPSSICSANRQRLIGDMHSLRPALFLIVRILAQAYAVRKQLFKQAG
jgi:hypothetical protein